MSVEWDINGRAVTHVSDGTYSTTLDGRVVAEDLPEPVQDGWVIDREKSQTYWFQASQTSYSATVKRDGCIHYYDESDAREFGGYWHICDLDAEIARLQALRETARQFFGDDWGT